jgi:hypothetical protein
LTVQIPRILLPSILMETLLPLRRVGIVVIFNDHGGCGNIVSSARDYVVTLEGSVPGREIAQMAEFDAWYVSGVDKVVNELEVRR